MLLVESVKPFQNCGSNDALFAVFQYHKRAVPVFDLSHEPYKVAFKTGFAESLREIILDEPRRLTVVVEGGGTRQIPPRRISDSRWSAERQIGLIKIARIGCEIAHPIP